MTPPARSDTTISSDASNTSNPSRRQARETSSKSPNLSVRIGIDIGGTFTDLTLIDDETGELVINKTLTTPEDPSLAVEQVTRGGLDAAGLAGARVNTVIHGTTLVANAIIERKGDRTALLTTKGFRDAA